MRIPCAGTGGDGDGCQSTLQPTKAHAMRIPCAGTGGDGDGCQSTLQPTKAHAMRRYGACPLTSSERRLSVRTIDGSTIQELPFVSHS